MTLKTSASQADFAAWTPGRRHYVLAILCVVGLLNFVDRQIITILIEPIKKEFGASDTEMGALTGLVFAGFYLAASVPLARVADLSVRRTLIAISVTIFSAMTVVGGWTTTLLQLALSRVGVAIGEAGTGPASYSMISDLYSLKNRATMISIFIALQAVGIGLGVFLGGWLAHAFNWRMAFTVVGVPGLILAVVIMLTVKEPPRGMSDKATKAATERPSLPEVARRLWRMKSFRLVTLTYMFAAMAGYGMLGWGPTLFIRAYHVNAPTAGFLFGSLTAVGYFVSGSLSGWLGDRFSKGDLRFYMRMASLGLIVAAPFGIATAFTSQPALGFVFLFLFQLSMNFQSPACVAMGQTLAPVRIRALASTVINIPNTVVGVGVAPFLIGALNDYFTPRFGPDAVRYSLAIIVTMGAVTASACALISTLWIREDHRQTMAEA